uniref:Uncharacterized protein n=1 Tax=Ditylenchus dipsaci TaxID=166011 RepID=A0A915DQQ0_9BILA
MIERVQALMSETLSQQYDTTQQMAPLNDPKSLASTPSSFISSSSGKNAVNHFCLAQPYFLLAECLDSDNKVDGDILVLNTDNFQDSLVAHEYLLVLYYQNGSSASNDFLGKLPALAKHLKKINSAIHVAKFEDNAQQSYKINYKKPTQLSSLNSALRQPMD